RVLTQISQRQSNDRRAISTGLLARSNHRRIVDRAGSHHQERSRPKTGLRGYRVGLGEHERVFVQSLAIAVMLHRGHFVTICIFAALASRAFAQLPTTQLTSVFPPGGQQGARVEVTIAGADLDDCSRLVFSHSGIAAEQKTAAATELEPWRRATKQSIVKIAGDVPPGVYEVRAQGRFGLSNPRAFVVGSSQEIIDEG